MTIVLDGGLATTLQARGEDISGALWSARLLLENPAAIEAAHAEFFRAGATVCTTASYQAGSLSLERAGLDPGQAADLISLSVRLGRRARDEVCPDGLVAGSLGAYGASLADGSEYTGDYRLPAGREVATLADFHRPRVAALAAAGADLIAVETIPTAVEAEAVARVLAEFALPAWVSFTPAAGGTSTRDGVPLDEACRPLLEVPGMRAVGVNCCPPAQASAALGCLAGLDRPASVGLIAYPNSGEQWDSPKARWVGEPGWDAGEVASWLTRVDLIGGCCRVGPAQIHELARRVKVALGAE
ncbi:MAG: homocysteine S-methyltransferase [Actinomycetales bacterium]